MASEAGEAFSEFTETKIVVTGKCARVEAMLELRSSEGAEFEIRRCAIRSSGFPGEAPAFSRTSRFTRGDRAEAARIVYHRCDSPTLMCLVRHRRSSPTQARELGRPLDR